MAVPKLKSEGKCIYCDELFTKAGISKHLNLHLEEEVKKQKNEKKSAFHIRAESDEMFLNLLIDGDAPLGILDTFLREIWLECCGHMSQFGTYGKEINMTKKISTVFKSGFETTYEYDFGTTTQLDIRVLAVYPFTVNGKIQLLSRNEPLEILCHKCSKEPAESICNVHIYDGEALFCKKCAVLHKKECEDFADYAEMPVVNSPRMGECGYTGGVIDLERDGRFKK